MSSLEFGCILSYSSLATCVASLYPGLFFHLTIGLMDCILLE
jgi:hypothetical protein